MSKAVFAEWNSLSQSTLAAATLWNFETSSVADGMDVCVGCRDNVCWHRMYWWVAFCCSDPDAMRVDLHCFGLHALSAQAPDCLATFFKWTTLHLNDSRVRWKVFEVFIENPVVLCAVKDVWKPVSFAFVVSSAFISRLVKRQRYFDFSLHKLHGADYLMCFFRLFINGHDKKIQRTVLNTLLSQCTLKNVYIQQYSSCNKCTD